MRRPPAKKIAARSALCRAGLIVVATGLIGILPIAKAQDTVGGHIGFVLPLVTHAGGQTTNLSDNFSIGFPMGITVKGRGKLAFDLELVPAVQDSPRQVKLTVHPALVYGLRPNSALRDWLAFDVYSS